MSDTSMKILSKADILASADLRTETICVPEWGGAVRVRTLTGTERDAFEATLVKSIDGQRVPDLENLRAKLCAATIVDESGRQVFEPSDLLALGKKSALAIDRVFTAAQRLNGLSAGATQDAERNFLSAPSDGSTFA